VHQVAFSLNQRNCFSPENSGFLLCEIWWTFFKKS